MNRFFQCATEGDRARWSLYRAGFSSVVAGFVILGSAPAGFTIETDPSAMPVPSTQAPSLHISQATVGGYLQLDDSGDAVAELQQRLTELGYYDGPISGYFGILTESAVMAFQQSQGLAADGIVGPSTVMALSQTGGASSAATDDGILQLGDRGPRIETLQSRLKELGFYQGVVDGSFGTQTETAVVAFQQSQGLAPDGLVGSATLTALNNPTWPPASTATPAPAPATPQPSATPMPAPTLPSAEPTVTVPSPNAADAPPMVTVPPPSVLTPAPLPATTTPQAPTVSALPPPDTQGEYSVLQLQWKLRNRGFYNGPLDGIMGTETQRAITEAQRRYGLTNSDLAAPN